MSQKKSIFVMALLISGLVGVSYWDDWQTKRDVEKKKIETKLLDGSAVNAVRVNFEARAVEDEEEDVSVVLTKTGKFWEIEQPIKYKADQRIVENLLKTIYEYNYAKVVAKGEERLPNFGLKDPARTIEIFDAEGESQTVFVGMKAPVGYDVYSKTSKSDQIFIGSQYLLVATAKTFFDFRHKGLVEMVQPEILKWTYFRKQKLGNIKLEFMPNKKGDFEIGYAKGLRSTRANQAAAKDFLEDIGALKTIGFNDAPSNELIAKFSDPDISVAWEYRDGARGSIRFIKSASKYYAAVDPKKLVFELPDNSKVRFEKDLMGFRDRRVFAFNSDNLMRVKIDGDQFVRVSGEWFSEEDSRKFDKHGKYEASGDRPKESVHIRALVGDLEFAKTFAYIQLKDPIVKKLPAAPSHRMLLEFKDNTEPPITADIFPANGEDKYRFIRYSGGEYLYKIDTKTLQSLTSSGHDASQKTL